MSKYIITVLVLFALIVRAQDKVSTGIIQGQIFGADGQPAAFVAVRIENTMTGAHTDEEGKFTIELLEGKHSLVVQAIGHEPHKKEIEVTAGKTTELHVFKLNETSKELEEVEIVGKSETQVLKESGFAVNSIDTKQFANTTTDLNQILNRSTGVRIRESGGTGSEFNFSINGLSGKAVKYFIDGIPMDVMGSGMTLNNIPVNLAERVEVYKGVVPVTLGADAMGGAVNVITNQKIKNYLDASYSLGSFNTHRAALTGQFTHQKTGIIVRANGFYNYSDNNYIMKNVEVVNQINDSTAEFVNKDVRRFHDNFQSGMAQLEFGVMNKKWADVLFIGASYTQTDKAVQTGSRQDEVYGKIRQYGKAGSISMRYKKDNILVKGLNFNLFTSRTIDQNLTVDTALALYDWNGVRGLSTVSENKGIRTLTNITRPKTYLRANLSYEINKIHSLNINYSLDHVRNKNYNELIEDKDFAPGTISKNIVGISYQQNLLNKRLANTFFGKYYGLSLKQQKWSTTEFRYYEDAQLRTYTGYGIASRYLITAQLGVKASFEKAYRLPETEEVFGNGLNTVPSPDLKPEKSNNFNLGLFNSLSFKKHKLFVEAGGFFRNATDFIFKIPGEKNRTYRYDNKSSVRVYGIEGEARYNYSEMITANLNATYQQSVNYTKYSKAGNTIPEATYLNKIPNLPWLFANFDLSIGKSNLLGKRTRLQANWYTQYVHWFYLTWEAFGNKDGKSTIPSQYIHTLSVSYSIKDGRYNISAECRNLTDALAYDNYKLQKPGRSYAVKLRYFIK